MVGPQPFGRVQCCEPGSQAVLGQHSLEIASPRTVLTTGFADAKASGGNTPHRLFRYLAVNFATLPLTALTGTRVE